jgi:hypothetical protein
MMDAQMFQVRETQMRVLGPEIMYSKQILEKHVAFVKVTIS